MNITNTQINFLLNITFENIKKYYSEKHTDFPSWLGNNNKVRNSIILYIQDIAEKNINKITKIEDIFKFITEKSIEEKNEELEQRYNKVSKKFSEDFCNKIFNNITFIRYNRNFQDICIDGIEIAFNNERTKNNNLNDIEIENKIDIDYIIKTAPYKILGAGLAYVLIVIFVLLALFVLILVYVLIIILATKKIKLPWHYKAFGWVPFYNIYIAIKLIKILKQVG